MKTKIQFSISRLLIVLIVYSLAFRCLLTFEKFGFHKWIIFMTAFAIATPAAALVMVIERQNWRPIRDLIIFSLMGAGIGFVVSVATADLASSPEELGLVRACLIIGFAVVFWIIGLKLLKRSKKSELDQDDES